MDNKNFDFTFFFEFFDKKMKYTVQAQNRAEAEKILRSKILIHRVETKDPTAIDRMRKKIQNAVDAVVSSMKNIYEDLGNH